METNLKTAIYSDGIFQCNGNHKLLQWTSAKKKKKTVAVGHASFNDSQQSQAV